MLIRDAGTPLRPPLKPTPERSPSGKPAAHSRRYEYATIAPTQLGGLPSIRIEPVNAETESIALEAADRGICWVLNRLAELGYRLLPGSRLDAWGDTHNGLVIMEREKA